ncbi:MAG: ribosome biogenesis GTP-binding protein YihA/YsxC [Bacteroidota bacterium]|nr:ribosome biogenesis GTP-binding protein YihA/YsxC [Bacteroidota bacterium]
MLIKSAVFTQSCVTLEKCPKTPLPEYAFIGRSNVGKSSLINMLTGKKGLAKVSGEPGKTRIINHFLINDSWFLVDLPGYGYAKASHAARADWEKMVFSYLSGRRNLMNSFVLIDVRLEPQRIDLEFVNWMGEAQLPFVMVFTKADKLSKVELSANIERYKNRLSEDWDELPPFLVSSAVTAQGKFEILDHIDESNKIFSQGK